MSVTTKAPQPWGAGPVTDKGEATVRARLIALILSSEAPTLDARRELALWLTPQGDQRVMSFAAWLAAWAFQRPLFLQGVLAGYPIPGHDVLAAVADLSRDEGAPQVEWGHTKREGQGAIVVRYTWAGLEEPLVFVRCPRVQPEGWTLPTELPPMPDAWRQEDGAYAFSVARAPAEAEILATWGPGRFDVGLDRTKLAGPTAPSGTRTSSPSAGPISSPSTPPSSSGAGRGGLPPPPAPAAAPETGSAGAATPAASPGADAADEANDALQDASSADEPTPRGDEGPEERAPGELFTPMAQVLCVLCRDKTRLKLADVVERFKAGCPACKKDPGAIVVLEEENGATKPLVDYMRAQGVPLPVAPSAAPAAETPAPAAEKPAPRKRPSRKPAAAPDGH